MKIKFLLAIGMGALIAFNSCKKDHSTTTTPGGPTTHSKQLKKVTVTESGTTTVYNLSYDAANRLLSYKNPDNSQYVLFSYDAQGNLTGIEQKDDEFKNIYSYTYQDNIPATGLFKSWQLAAGQPDELIEDDHLTYTVSNNKVTGIRLDMLQTGSTVDLQLTYTANNLTRVVSTGQIEYTADFSFGTHRSAFPKVSDYVLDQAGFSLQFACNNEMLSQSFDFPGTSYDSFTTTQYTFDADGYALTSNDGTTQMVFEYQ